MTDDMYCLETDVVMIRGVIAASLALAVANGSCWAAVPPAFPGAEGAGMYSLGGRGGVVYEVTNLNDSGAGSFRAACTASGPRTVIFRVSGTIVLNSRIDITNPYITIAGQTAPGDGICIRRNSLGVVATHDVIIRYLRCRRGDETRVATGATGDSLGVSAPSSNVIIDHCSVSWSTDENLSSYPNDAVTIQWCMIGEGLFPHNCGGIWGSNTSYHHNLLYSNGTRNPRFTIPSTETTSEVFDFRNNVIYNWGYQSGYTGGIGVINIVGNYYEYGPGTRPNEDLRHRIVYSYEVVGNDDLMHIYAEGNYVWGYPAVTADNWAGGIQGSCVRASVPGVAPGISQQTAEVAYQYVLASAGAVRPHRDPVDLRVIDQARNRTYTFSTTYDGNVYNGLLESQDQAGGWPQLNTYDVPTDSDHDGMPDPWETSKGLNPSDAADRNNYTLSPYYTNLEIYLNSLCPDPYAPTPNPMTFANAPYAASTTSIAMSASAASDPLGVQYYFTNVTIVDGSHDSGWQQGTSYTDTGLAPMTAYTYTVKARSAGGFHNATIASLEASASTDAPPDHEAPEPNMMAWSAAPAALGIDTIRMTATTATDRSGVEYFFENRTDPNHSSSWQDSPIYTDTGLANNTNYVYKVKARDLSPFLNETQWSADANATTARYVCLGPSAADLDNNCEVDLRDLAVLAVLWGANPPEPSDAVNNGTFDTDTAGWEFLPPVATDGIVTASFDAMDGSPAGSALISADTTLAATNSARFYQIIPVEVGRQYKLSGDWMGDIKGTVGTVTNARNWAEIYVTFVTDGSAVPTSWGSIMYKKAFGVANQNIGPTGAWSWEPITASVADGPADGVFTATDDYMVVAVNLGGRINSGQTYANVDNFGVVPTAACMEVDLNEDCVLDFLDVLDFASCYLSCGRDPSAECWQ